MFKTFRKLATKSPELVKLQSALESVINPLTKVEIIDGHLLKNITVTSAGVVVPHELSRDLLGWFVVDINANAKVWKTASNDRTISLTSGATCTISLWVF